MKSIYALLDPITNEVKYVGQSSDPEKRYITHTKTKNQSPVSLWARSFAVGMKPEMVTLESVADEESHDAERFWIGYFRSLGANLLNQVHNGYRHLQGWSGIRQSLRAKYGPGGRVYLKGLRHARARQDVSVRDLALAINKTKGWIDRCETLECAAPLRDLYLFSMVLGCSTDEIVYRSGCNNHLWPCSL